MIPSITVVTPIAPDKADHIDGTAAAIESLRQIAKIQWILIWDGLKTKDVSEADLVIEMGQRSGISAARNASLPFAQNDFIVPVDADDLIEVSGVKAAVEYMTENKGLGWVSLNRTLMDGTPTSHWKNTARVYSPGELAMEWTAPFSFHPNSIVYRTSTIVGIGGWPAVGVNEDLGAALLASERDSGAFLPDILTRYRVWDKQVVAEEWYSSAKRLSFLFLEEIVNAVRYTAGRGQISSPAEPGGAHGVR